MIIINISIINKLNIFGKYNLYNFTLYIKDYDFRVNM